MISKARLENLVARRFALERVNAQLRRQNDEQRVLLRSALLELARHEGSKNPDKFRRLWIAERIGRGVL